MTVPNWTGIRLFINHLYSGQKTRGFIYLFIKHILGLKKKEAHRQRVLQDEIVYSLNYYHNFFFQKLCDSICTTETTNNLIKLVFWRGRNLTFFCFCTRDQKSIKLQCRSYFLESILIWKNLFPTCMMCFHGPRCVIVLGFLWNMRSVRNASSPSWLCYHLWSCRHPCYGI